MSDPYEIPDQQGYQFKEPSLGAYSVGLDTGNPMADLVSKLLLGKNYLPRPVGAQDAYDAFLQRDRSQQFLRIQSEAFGNNQLFRHFGINPNSDAMRFGGLAFGGPNSAAMRALSPLIGGNPVAAQMQLYAGMTGTTMGALGRTDNVGYFETSRAMNALNDVFYNQRQFDVGKANNNALRDLQNQFQGADGAKSLMSRYGIKPNQLTQGWLDNYKPPVDTSGYKIGGSIQQAINDMNFDTDAQMQGSDSEVLQKKKDLIVARAKRLREELTGAGIDKKILDKYINVDKMQSASSIADMGKYDDIRGIEQAALNDPALQAKLLQAGNKSLAGTKVWDNINYRNTRGFNLEDFTSGATAASDLRLVGRNGGDAATMMKNFAINAPGAMSAARSVFGSDKSGSELINEISRFMGTGSADLTSESGAHKVEDLLRNTKAAARLAGASIDSILGIIKEGQMLAQSQPGLQYMSGSAVAEMTQRALQSVTAVNAASPSDMIRRQGGVQSMVGQSVAEQIRLAGSQPSMQLAAMMQLMTSSGGPHSAEALAAIQAFSQGKDTKGNSIRVGPGSYGVLLNQLEKITGMSSMQIQTFATDPVHQSLAMSNDAFKDVGVAGATQMVGDRFIDLVAQKYGGGDKGRKAALDAIAAEAKRNGGDWQAAVRVIAPVGATQMLESQGADMYESVIDNSVRPLRDPKFAASMASIKENQKQMVAQDKYIDEIWGYMNAPASQRIFQDFMSAEPGKYKIEEVMGALKDSVRGKDGTWISAEDSPDKAISDRAKKNNAANAVKAGFMEDFQNSLSAANADPATRDKRVQDAAAKLVSQLSGNKFSGRTAGIAEQMLYGYNSLGELRSGINAMKADKSTSSDQLEAIKYLESSGALDSEGAFNVGHSKGLAASPQMAFLQLHRQNVESNPLIQKQFADDDARSQTDFSKLANDPSMKKNKAFAAIGKAFSKGGKFDAKAYADALNDPEQYAKTLKDAGYTGGMDSDEYKSATQSLNNDASLRQGVTAKVQSIVNPKAPTEGGDDLLKKIADALNGLGGSGGSLTKIGNALQSLTG
jgi:hypothetical protein